ncbi:hypothetical protein AYO45_02115 [Gammaproteobacteria bacterium SCGC AG-212-F23]|nr:hypothetical protein AYO45_02115 [Gammaproteobacteria bacterium SCGC AG-212-F23]
MTTQAQPEAWRELIRQHQLFQQFLTERTIGFWWWKKTLADYAERAAWNIRTVDDRVQAYNKSWIWWWTWLSTDIRIQKEWLAYQKCEAHFAKIIPTCFTIEKLNEKEMPTEAHTHFTTLKAEALTALQNEPYARELPSTFQILFNSVANVVKSLWQRITQFASSNSTKDSNTEAGNSKADKKQETKAEAGVVLNFTESYDLLHCCGVMGITWDKTSSLTITQDMIESSFKKGMMKLHPDKVTPGILLDTNYVRYPQKLRDKHNENHKEFKEARDKCIELLTREKKSLIVPYVTLSQDQRTVLSSAYEYSLKYVEYNRTQAPDQIKKQDELNREKADIEEKRTVLSTNKVSTSVLASEYSTAITQYDKRCGDLKVEEEKQLKLFKEIPDNLRTLHGIHYCGSNNVIRKIRSNIFSLESKLEEIPVLSTNVIKPGEEKIFEEKLKETKAYVAAVKADTAEINRLSAEASRLSASAKGEAEKTIINNQLIHQVVGNLLRSRAIQTDPTLVAQLTNFNMFSSLPPVVVTGIDNSTNSTNANAVNNTAATSSSSAASETPLNSTSVPVNRNGL